MLPEASVKPHDPTKAVVSGPQTGREPTEWHGPLTGAIPIALDRWYVKRRTDDEFLAAVKRRDSILLIKGPRQAGKTSLMVRGIARAREENWRIITTDFQKLNASDLVSTEALFRALTADIIDDLDLDLNPDDVWTGRRGPSVTFERFLRREVLEPMPMPLIWCIDEVDRMFGCDFGSEVFGLFRSWHNERALDPTGPWSRLTLVIGYATEAHLFISDLNQSPFNVGTTFELQDFTTEQISELNDRYGNPLKNLSEVTAMHTLVHGHPYLVQRCLYEMASQNIGMTDLEEIADRDNGPLSDHLKRLLMLLAQDSEMREVIKGVLRGEPCPTPESFYRLRSAGLLVGDSARDARMRGRLYANYLERHLLSRAN